MTSADHVCLLCMRETALPHQYPCPFCGGDDRTLTLQSPALPPRTVLDHRYVVGKTLGQGGFGITYQAYDLRVSNTVALKEYFPSSLVGRDSSVSSTVTVNAVKGTRALDEYASGLRHFLFEARRQAKLASSPGVVSVTDFFEANNTAYYVMEFVDGSTLVKYIQRPLPIDQVLRLLEPIADSLISIHDSGLIHRDISPDNIMCAKNGQRKLLDFGASHSFTEEESTTGNATLKHGFAPPEQYGSSSMQGPWTDVYAFAATVYWCLTGKIPPDSMDRSIGGDKLQLPSQLGAVISPEAEAILMRGMALPVTARYQSVSSFWNKLKKAAAPSSDHRIVPPTPSFSDPNGRTTVVSSLEVPEHTKVPESAMESPHSSPSKSSVMQSPEQTRHPSPTQQQESRSSHYHAEDNPSPEPISPPDITLYRSSLYDPDHSPLPNDSERAEPAQSPPEAPPVEPVRREPPPKPDNRLLIALVGVIAVLVVAMAGIMLGGNHFFPGDSSITDVGQVTIAGTPFPIDTTELYLSGDPDYVKRYKEESDFTAVSYLSKADWQAVCQLTSLKKLSLVGCSLSTLSGIEQLNQLEVLDLSDNSISDLTPLSGLDTLMELSLADNDISDPTPLSDLTSLIYLDLADNQLADVSPLSGLTHLSSLYLQKNQLTDVSPLGSLTDLSTLDLADNHLFSLTALYSLQDLRMLYLDGNSFTNSQLVSFTSRLSECALDVDVLTDIPEEVTIGGQTYPTSLTELDLSSSSLRDGDIDQLKYMVNLTWLDLSGNELSDFSSISRLYALSYLSLSYNRITDISFLSGLIRLDTLYLSSNQLTDLSPLSGLTNLETLAVGNNPISDLTAIKPLTRLKLLAMCDCEVESLEPLYPLSNLVELRVSQGTYSEETLSAVRDAVHCTINQY